MATQWNYHQQGQVQGPVSEEQLKALLASGALAWTDLVWREGMAEWSAANQVPELIQAPAPARIELDLAPTPAAPANPFSPPQAELIGASWGGPAQGSVSADVVELLRQTKPWVRLLAVLGFIGIGFMILGSLAMLAVSSASHSAMPLGAGVGIMLVYLVMAGFQFPAALFLNRYASRIGTLVDSGSPEALQEALAAQKSFWRYVGILTLVFICLYVVVIVVAVFAATALRGLH